MFTTYSFGEGIKIWEYEDASRCERLVSSIPAKSVSNCRFNFDGSKIVAKCEHTKYVLINLATDEQSVIFEDKHRTGMRLALSQQDTKCVIGTNAITIYDLDSGLTPLHSLQPYHDEMLAAMYLSPDGNSLLLLNKARNALRLIDITIREATTEPIQEETCAMDAPRPESAVDGEAVENANVPTPTYQCLGTELFVETDPSFSILAAAFSGYGDRFVVCKFKSMAIWTTLTLEKVVEWEYSEFIMKHKYNSQNCSDWFHSLKWSHDTTKVLINHECGIHVWNSFTGELIHFFDLRNQQCDTPNFSTGFLSHSAHIVIAGYAGGIVKVFDVVTGQQRHSWKAHQRFAEFGSIPPSFAVLL